MDTGGSSEQFELVFEGLNDESEDTLRKVKGIFLAELDLSATQAMEILQNFPSTIATASNEADLSKHYKALKGAGCKVMLVRPSGANGSGVEELSLTVDYDFSGALESLDRAKEEVQKEMQELEEELVEYHTDDDDEDADGEVLEFSLDLDELTEEQVAEVAATEKSGSVPTYSLDMDEATDSPGMDDEIEGLIKSIDKPPVVDALDDPDQVMSSVEEGSEDAPSETPQAEASSSWDLNIDLDTAPAVEELVETAAPVSQQVEGAVAAEVVEKDEFDLTINLEDDIVPATEEATESETTSETDQQIADLASELSAGQVVDDQQLSAGILKAEEDSSTAEPEASKIASEDLAADLIPDTPLFSFDDKAPEAILEVEEEKAAAEPMTDLSLSFDDEPKVAEVTIESIPSAPVEAPEEVSFSFDDDASASAEDSATPAEEAKAPVVTDSGLSLDDVADAIVIEPANATPEIAPENSAMSLTTEEPQAPQLSTTDDSQAADHSAGEDDEPPTSLPPLATVSKKKAKVTPKKIAPEEEENSVEVAAEEDGVEFEEAVRAKKGKRPPIDMICAVLVGVALLAYYHLVKQPEPQTRGIQISPEAIEATLQRQRSAAQVPAAKTQPAAKVDPADSLPEVTHSGEFNNEQFSYTWKLTARGDKPIYLTLEGTTPEPPELTPEQVVRQESRAPWIEKFETDRIRFIPGDDNVSTGSGVSKFYVERSSGRDRVVGRVHVTAQRSKDEISLAFTMWAGTEEMPITDEDFLLEASDTPGVPFKTYLTGAMLQSTLIEEPAPEGVEVAADTGPVQEPESNE